MPVFKRGLSDDFTKALRLLANDSGNNWWKEVLANEDLLLAVRGGYLNAYVKGQSVFKIGPEIDDGKPSVKTHFKYLVAPKMDGGNSYVSFDAEEKTFKIDPAKAIQTRYELGVTLKQMVRTAARFSGAEKIGVHKIAANEPNLVDVEIAFNPTDDAQEMPTTPRMDIAVLVPGKSREVQLVFCEAKCADNVELWKLEKKSPSADPEIAVVAQVAKYEKFIRENESAVVNAYKRTCQTLLELSKERGKRRSSLVEAVATGATLTVHPQVYLLIYGFDADQKAGAVQKKCDELRRRLGPRVIEKGNPDSFKLSDDIRRCALKASIGNLMPIAK